MESLAQFNELRNTINTISLNLHSITTHLNLIELLDPIPDEIETLLSDPVLKSLSTLCSDNLTELNNKLNEFNPKVKAQVYKQKHLDDDSKPYASFKIDEAPIKGTKKDIIENKNGQLVFNFDNLMEEYSLNNDGNTITPIKRKVELSYKGSCPVCNAPNSYIYDNNKRGQLKCKVCSHTFSYQTKMYDEIAFYCPHCNHKLDIQHDRKEYLVYRCINDKCSYYLNNKNEIDNSDNDINPNEKRRYHYRDFKFNMSELNNDEIKFDTKVNLSNIHHSLKTVGLALTFMINYGLSSRKTARALYDLFGIKISHQTIFNYLEASMSYLQNLVLNYEYNLSNTLTGDETYVTVKGKHHYVFFFSDPVNKIITSYKIYENRDTKCAVESLLMSLRKYKEIKEDLLVITDANPIYNAAQVFLYLNGINFNLQQVPLVSNKDEVSKLYRPIKQTEERLNRTFKENYYGMNGYNSLYKANVYMVLYTTFYNFLREHSSLNYKVPAIIDGISDYTFMYDKWMFLLSESSKYMRI